jgi:hypothetical protein
MYWKEKTDSVCRRLNQIDPGREYHTRRRPGGGYEIAATIGTLPRQSSWQLLYIQGLEYLASLQRDRLLELEEYRQ